MRALVMKVGMLVFVKMDSLAKGETGGSDFEAAGSEDPAVFALEVG
jgi:hypothetical protein